MPTARVRFTRTERAATAERAVRWDVIAAIADDAVAAELATFLESAETR